MIIQGVKEVKENTQKQVSKTQEIWITAWEATETIELKWNTKKKNIQMKPKK
jgi:hypothetical protein